MPAQQQQVMSAMPMVDGEEGNLEIKTQGGQQYIKLYDPVLGETWGKWVPPEAANLAHADGVQPKDKSFFSKFGDVASFTGQQVETGYGTTSGPASGAGSSLPGSTTTDTVHEEEKAPIIEEKGSTAKEAGETTLKSAKATSGAPRLNCLATTAALILVTAAMVM